MQISDTFYDDAMAWRRISTVLAKYVGHYVKCTCVETKDYKSYRESLMELPEGADRLLKAILEPYEGKETEETCLRCKVLSLYEEAVGRDVMTYEATTLKVTPVKTFEKGYECAVCDKPIADDEDIHTAPDDINDCHADCCPWCNEEDN